MCVYLQIQNMPVHSERSLIAKSYVGVAPIFSVAISGALIANSKRSL